MKKIYRILFSREKLFSSTSSFFQPWEIFCSTPPPSSFSALGSFFFNSTLRNFFHLAWFLSALRPQKSGSLQEVASKRPSAHSHTFTRKAGDGLYFISTRKPNFSMFSSGGLLPAKLLKKRRLAEQHLGISGLRRTSKSVPSAGLFRSGAHCTCTCSASL